ncbi:MAG: glycosyl hydrolase family 2, partial [Alistipes sp.]|nr:glycosyl hydrolase family 2 [Alistipes sp.]
MLRAGERLAEPLRPSEAKQRPVAQLQALQAVSDKGRRLDLLGRVDADGVLDWTAPSGEWTLYALWAGRTFQKVKRAAPGGEGLVLNHYNRGAVERYLHRFDEAFAASGAPWPDTFFNDSFEVYGSDWDTTLLAEFEREHGYR